MTSARERFYKAMREEQLRAQVVDLAGYGGWRHYHTLRSKGSPAGFPDEVFLRPDGYMVVAELKRQDAAPTPAQEDWLADFEALAYAVRQLQRPVGPPLDPPRIQVDVWRPSDLPRIERILLGGRRAGVGR
jgi:hypothetical protein